MIKVIIFDFYGVICSEIGSPWYKTRPSQELVAELKSKYDKPSNLGDISEDEFFTGIGQAVSLAKEDIRKEWLDAGVIDSDMVRYIKELKEDYQLAICSNTQPKLFRDLLQNNNLEKLFDVIVSSSEVGMIKPNADMYNYTLAQLKVEADEAIFIDDRVLNTKGAEAIRIQSLLYSDLNKLKLDLKDIL